MRDLAGYTITVNGTQLPLDVPAAIHACRTALNPAGRWCTASPKATPPNPTSSPREIANLLRRQLALTRLLARLTCDLGAAAALPVGRELEALRPNVSFITAQSSTIDGGWLPH
ncbi:hypothetical protein [Streptomyces sp. NPDC092307]|uniref:hypothetical protein n=1 Tax=Streptomyces sp. NPDC092307 TaxID=3366013 RepID=UPI00383000E6